MDESRITVACRNVWKVYGPKAQSIVGSPDASLSRQQLMEKTSCVAAVRDVSFEVAPGEVAFSSKLQTKAPQAFAFLTAMSYSNDAQDQIANDIQGGMSAQAAAQKWIDANPTVWQPWVDAGLAAG